MRQISSPVEMRTSFLMTVRREREGLWGLRVREKMRQVLTAPHSFGERMSTLETNHICVLSTVTTSPPIALQFVWCSCPPNCECRSCINIRIRTERDKAGPGYGSVTAPPGLIITLSLHLALARPALLRLPTTALISKQFCSPSQLSVCVSLSQTQS